MPHISTLAMPFGTPLQSAQLDPSPPQTQHTSVMGPGAGLPSSIAPLQSLSTPSQTSALGASGAAEHVNEPPEPHTITPVFWHAPVPVVQTSVVVMLSSTRPLQSLSMPSHTSTEG